ncbi:CLUMA_CG004237, isoform A [Clunio marinus]|uniref:Metalloendopeptidase n=1 Tax=Clunio marinus TaxID=568069 RepID=A0A1J1HR84_9DIPT|nr:CLUMA_CG004237, isoform A [Clunio marinus]
MAKLRFVGFLFLVNFASCLYINTTSNGTETENASEESEANGEEIGGNFQGDMILSPSQIYSLFSMSRNGLIDERYRWPKNSDGIVEVAYKFEVGDFTLSEKETIRKAMDEIESVSCIKFVHSDDALMKIYDGMGCASAVGMQTDRQYVSLNSQYCIKSGKIIHELLHALGFYHMQNAYDRDDYIKINFDNIEKGFESNFARYRNSEVSYFDTGYDYGSVMHYSPYGFSKNGLKTIEPIKEAKDSDKAQQMGQREGMSDGDVKRLNNMYQCSSKINQNE